MNFSATFSLALSALLRNKLRSSLTMLGVVIGVAAVVLMQAMGQGATAYVGEAISGLGGNMLMLIPGATRGGGAFGAPLFTQRDVEALRREISGLRWVAASNQRNLRLVAGANNRTSVVAGVTPEYFRIRDWGVAAGRSISEIDDRQAALVCVIGETIREVLFLGRDPVGKTLRVRDLTCRVTGVLTPKGASAFGFDQDDVVFMPFNTFARRIVGHDRIGVITVMPSDAERLDAVKAAIEKLMHQRRHIPEGEDDDFGVRDPREIMNLLQRVTGLLTTLLASVAAVSLLVGGIGIMNIMLVSVTERTREIGVRLAVGARARDVLAQFLVEAVLLSSVGGVLGLIIGLTAAYGVAHGLKIPYVVPTVAAPLAFGVSVLVGVVFGVFPARKAARLNPLAALRFE